MTKYVDIMCCDNCQEDFPVAYEYKFCPYCKNSKLFEAREKISSGYTIQFNAKNGDGKIIEIRQMPIPEGDYLGLHIEEFIEDDNVATIEVCLSAENTVKRNEQ